MLLKYHIQDPISLMLTCNSNNESNKSSTLILI